MSEITEQNQDRLIIVIPAYNEEENIENVVAQWHPIVEKTGGDSRLFVINDGRILEAVGRQEKVWAFDWKQKKKTGRLAADLCDTGSSTGDPCDISLLGGRCQYTVPADAGCRTGRSFNRDSTTVFSGKCTDDGAIYKRRTAGNVLSNYIPSATGWSQFHQYEKNCKNR